MSGIRRIIAIGMTVLSGIAIYCFYSLKYPYHLHFQEQYQLFEFTWAYFLSVSCVPGGLADWIGRFLTQFCYYAPAGAAVIALLLCSVQLLTFAAAGKKNLSTYALSFLPVIPLMAFYCDENALLGGTVAIAILLAASALCRPIRARRLRLVIEAALIPVLYMACGSLTVFYVLITILSECIENKAKALPFALISTVLAVACPLIAVHIFPYVLERLVLGVHYYRYHNILPVMLWVAGLFTAVTACLGSLEFWDGLSRKHILSGSLIYCLLVLLGTGLTIKSADWAKEEWMHYDFMVRMEMWNRIMMTADRKNPDKPMTVSCLNLALSKTGRMSDHQFDYFQNGPEGLIPAFKGDFTSPVPTGEIYWHLGMVNTAQHFAFEAQEAIPDFQKSARLYKRLAQTNIVNGDWGVARKYLKSLHNTLFYRRWADETVALLDSGEIFEKRPELARARDLRLKEHDFLFSETEMDSMLGLLRVENPSNDIALDYMMSWCLLKKDLGRFVKLIGMVTAPTMPKSYQEALLLRWVLTHDSFEGLPSYLLPAHAQRISRFINDLQAGKKEDQMRRDYGDTYWFYYYFRYRS